ncbi:unnamed protein product [Kuraishia capsulata CBS 1993]|uniref:Protein BFR2 n=1 Tax=Kuraishia capsulata CBS 1993 TaxID=1382522 RepID=W6MLX9_9ASCO|nr:uncharacterized protein KUCA_T00003502001 [Kuraishia capsulata CBS 1993]CDK27524.1 unnamed protein product [Kuraishia capsulata CBS 1993]
MAKRTLGERIADSATPKGRDFDIENEELAQFNDSDASGSDSDDANDGLKTQHYVVPQKSKLRDNKAKLGKGYEGAKTSRSEIYSEDEEDEEDEEDSQEEVSDTSEDDQDPNDSQSQEEEEDSESEVELETPEEEALKRSKLQEMITREKQVMISQLSESAKNDAAKGYAVLQQQKTFDSILDTRIKFQKALNSVNELPLDKASFKKHSTPKSRELVSTIRDSICTLLNQIYHTRTVLFEKEQVITAGSDLKEPKGLKRNNFEAFQKDGEYLDSTLQKFRDPVLVKWWNKVSNASGTNALNNSKFKAINQNSLVQVQNNLQDMERLLKRTKLNRRNIKPLGYQPRESDNESGSDDDEDREPEITQTAGNELPFILDDEDFYRVLLNDLVDKKLSSAQNEGAGPQIVISTSKLHKNYERKASKGRKLRYTAQEPLQNFEAPKTGSISWGDSQIDEFFASLLGQRVNMNEESEAEDVSDDESEDDIINDDLQIFG